MFLTTPVFCAAVLIFQTVSGQAIGHGIYGNNYANAVAAEAAYANGLPYGPPVKAEAGLANVAYAAAATAEANNLAYAPVAEIIPEVRTGGNLKVTSYSSIAPTGITVQSDNLVFEGPLAVSGQMPFTGVVALEGPLPSVGQGAVAYAGGDGNVGIVQENIEGGYANVEGVAAYPNPRGVPEFGYNGVGRVGGSIY